MNVYMKIYIERDTERRLFILSPADEKVWQ